MVVLHKAQHLLPLTGIYLLKSTPITSECYWGVPHFIKYYTRSWEVRILRNLQQRSMGLTTVLKAPISCMIRSWEFYFPSNESHLQKPIQTSPAKKNKMRSNHARNMQIFSEAPPRIDVRFYLLHDALRRLLQCLKVLLLLLLRHMLLVLLCRGRWGLGSWAVHSGTVPILCARGQHRYHLKLPPGGRDKRHKRERREKWPLV